MLTKEWLVLTKERFTHTKSPYDFLFNFINYTRLNLTSLLINLLELSRLNLNLFLCEGMVVLLMFHLRMWSMVSVLFPREGRI